MTRQRKGREPGMLAAFRNWMATRTEELRRDGYQRSKKDCWRIAQSEWIEMRRHEERAKREAARSSVTIVHALSTLN